MHRLHVKKRNEIYIHMILIEETTYWSMVLLVLMFFHDSPIKHPYGARENELNFSMRLMLWYMNIFIAATDKWTTFSTHVT